MTPGRDREALDQAIVRGSELLKQNKLDQAVRAFHAALELEPDNTKVLALLGLAHFRASQFADARPIYEDLVERSPTDASHRLNLGLVYLKLGDGDRAINALEASRALDPSQGRAVSYLGLAYARAGRYVEAYRSFLLAGQVELASEIEINLTATERDGIHSQLGRTAPVGPHDRPTPLPAAVIPREPTPAARAAAPTAPPPIADAEPAGATADPAPIETVPLAAAADPAPPPIADTPAPPTTLPAITTPSNAPTTGRAISQNIVSRAVLGDSGRIPPTEPRPRPPSQPPTSRNRTPTVPVPQMSSGEITIIHDTPPVLDLATSFTRSIASARNQSDIATVPIPTVRMSESQQFVMPNRDPAAPGPARPSDGHSMVSMAVAAAAPAPPPPVRTAAGGTPPRPLSELATDELIRPEDGTDPFEIGANGALIIRVASRVLTRLDGVHVSGGDLSYEVATRRSRGHQTDEKFDYGATPLYAVSGTGFLIAVPGAREFAAVMLDDDILYLREDLVFAFESTLRWENGNVPGLRGKLPVVQFRGDGALALRVTRPLVRVKLSPQGLVFVEAERLAGWIGRVIPRAVVPPPGSPMGAMCIECTGEGVVLVEPAAEPEQRPASPRATPPPPPPPPAPAPAPASEAPAPDDAGDTRSPDDALDQLGRLDD